MIAYKNDRILKNVTCIYESDYHDISGLALYEARGVYYVGLWDSVHVELICKVSEDSKDSAVEFFRAYELEYMEDLEM